MGSKFVIWGASGHAKVVAGSIYRSGGTIAATLDVRTDVPAMFDAPGFRGVDAFDQWLATIRNPSDYRGVICIGGARGDDRINVLARMRAAGLDLRPMIDTEAFVDRTARLGEASQVLPGAVVSAEAVVGDACIINHRSSVDHESRLAEGVHVAPGVTICGLVEVDRAAFLGAGSVVLPRLSIGAYATVGAGAVVTQNVPRSAIVVGIPAKPSTRKSS